MYILNREAMRVVEKNDKGIVTYRKRYRKGDEVDTGHMDEAHVDSLVESGVLVESEDDVTPEGDASAISPTSGPFGAATGEATATTATTDAVVTEEDEAEQIGDPDSGSVAANTLQPSNPESEVVPPARTDDDDVEAVDQYSDMDYPTLQKTAKARDLNAGGSGDEIRARLREADASNA